jgi:mannose/cellobiose epimerase-like protein (N-acyl-D-glucosamine 2-epimerase family)
MRLRRRPPTRKERFVAALALAGMTMTEWRTQVYPVSAQHLAEVWKYESDPLRGRRRRSMRGRKPSARLLAAIDDFIAEVARMRLVIGLQVSQGASSIGAAPDDPARQAV